jgi:hypothetical protein
MTIAALEAGIAAVGYEKLNIEKGEIGTHSLRSGAAIALYLGEVPVYVIMMMVKQCIPLIHQETSQTIQQQHLQENDQASISQAHP